jgi:hypothetical protein
MRRVVPGKHRHALALDSEMAAAIEAKRLPYPKRSAPESSSCDGAPIAEGGATPTPALQSTATKEVNR